MIEKLETRLNELQQHKQKLEAILNQAVADINMTIGSMQEVTRLIEIFKQMEIKKED